MATEKKSMMFIDAGNLLGGWRGYCRSKKNTFKDEKNENERIEKKIDYQKLIKVISKDTDFIRAYFYDAVQEPIDNKKMRFFDKLREFEITIVTKRLRYKSITCPNCNSIDDGIPYQKDVDVALVTDLMSLSIEKAFDIAIIVSGDNDFVDAINFVKSKGIKVWVASFVYSLGEDTMRAADKVIKLDSLFKEIAR